MPEDIRYENTVKGLLGKYFCKKDPNLFSKTQFDEPIRQIVAVNVSSYDTIFKDTGLKFGPKLKMKIDSKELYFMSVTYMYVNVDEPLPRTWTIEGTNETFFRSFYIADTIEEIQLFRELMDY